MAYATGGHRDCTRKWTALPRSHGYRHRGPSADLRYGPIGAGLTGPRSSRSRAAKVRKHVPGTVSETTTSPTSAPGTSPAPDPRRWIALSVIAVAQLMVVLDATIVNTALPQAQRDLGITDANRQWVITAYTLAFGGLLLLGGRIADYWGRKRTFVVG